MKSEIEKYIIETKPHLKFSQLTARGIKRTSLSLGFKMWRKEKNKKELLKALEKLKTAAAENKKAVDDWAKNCKL